MNQSGQINTDHTTNFFWMIVLVFGMGVCFWWVDKKYIVSFFFMWRHGEIVFIEWLVKSYTVLAQYLHLPMPHVSHPLSWWQAFMMTHKDYSSVSFNQIAALSRDVGLWLRMPVIMILLAFSVILYCRHASTRFVQNYSMSSLRKLEVHNWPQIAPIFNVDLVKTDLDEGPWSMAATPLIYCKKHHLIEPLSHGDKKCWSVCRGAAYRQFVLQLGPLWNGPEALSIHLQALLVIFIARAERKREMANRLMIQIARSAASGKLDFSGVVEQIKKLRQSNILSWIAKRHAYVGTLMASLLEMARLDGVLATSEFLWLKPVDRRMWYLLNTVGRQTSVVEIAGLHAHWLAEKKLKRALRTPMVQAAVLGLEAAVADILYIEEDDLWHFNVD